jgi:hypothetical protein
VSSRTAYLERLDFSLGRSIEPSVLSVRHGRLKAAPARPCARYKSGRSIAGSGILSNYDPGPCTMYGIKWVMRSNRPGGFDSTRPPGCFFIGPLGRARKER